MLLALFCLLAACDATTDAIYDGPSSSGTVYVCDTGQGCGERDEYCFGGTEAELEAVLGADCHRIKWSERWWPALVGCAYCCGDGCGRGANAFCGSACPS